MDCWLEITKYNWVLWIAGLFALLEFGKWAWSLIEYYLAKFNIETKGMRKRREEHDILMKTVKKVDTLEEKDNAIQKDVNDVLDLLREHIETDKNNTRATFRSSLYRMHSDFTSRGFITKEGLKTFLECGSAYELADGDDIYHDKLKPEIMKLPIREADSDGVLIEDI
jgi:hypothetical protein